MGLVDRLGRVGHMGPAGPVPVVDHRVERPVAVRVPDPLVDDRRRAVARVDRVADAARVRHLGVRQLGNARPDGLERVGVEVAELVALLVGEVRRGGRRENAVAGRAPSEIFN